LDLRCGWFHAQSVPAAVVKQPSIPVKQKRAVTKMSSGPTIKQFSLSCASALNAPLAA
jgi:hypothetical protein